MAPFHKISKEFRHSIAIETLAKCLLMTVDLGQLSSSMVMPILLFLSTSDYQHAAQGVR